MGFARGSSLWEMAVRVGEAGASSEKPPAPTRDSTYAAYFGSAASTSGSTLAAYLVKFSRKRPARSLAVVS